MQRQRKEKKIGMGKGMETKTERMGGKASPPTAHSPPWWFPERVLMLPWAHFEGKSERGSTIGFDRWNALQVHLMERRHISTERIEWSYI